MSKFEFELDEPTESDIMRMLRNAVFDSVVECPYCDTRLEPDYETCPMCDKPNPLMERGMI